MAANQPDVIKCTACGSREVQVVGRLEHAAAVSCSRCGTTLWTWPEFLQRIRDTLAGREQGISGGRAPRSQQVR
jgi:hypothetical protein